MTTIVDYGAGNLRSVQNTLDELGAEYVTSQEPQAVSASEKIILPGVGHFGHMMRRLDQLGLREPLLERLRAQVPFLGICVGLQCLFEGSEESPGAKGLGIFSGSVKRFTGDARIPHMGWNSLSRTKASQLLKGLVDGTYTYFAHSYYAPITGASVATCTYIHPYTAILEQENVYAVQFHPEKSGPAGLRIMRNFLDL
jgi:imidazole glycerol phosphate synthase glutamine amidotransferase subunit